MDKDGTIMTVRGHSIGKGSPYHDECNTDPRNLYGFTCEEYEALIYLYAGYNCTQVKDLI